MGTNNGDTSLRDELLYHLFSAELNLLTYCL